MMKKYSCLLLLALLFGACTENTPFRPYATVTGKTVPIGAFFQISPTGTSFNKNTTMNLQMGYWCQDGIQTIRLRQRNVGTTDTLLVREIPYTPSFSAFREMDTLVLDYVTPSNLAANARIQLILEVISKKNVARRVGTQDFTIR